MTTQGDGSPSTARATRSRPVRIRIVTSSTGAGHTRAAEALTEALHRRAGERVAVHTVDVMDGFAPFPLHHAPAWGAAWTGRALSTYGWGFWLTNGQRRTSAMLRSVWPGVRPNACRLLGPTEADVVVSTYSLVNHFLAWAREELRVPTPIVTMVTDPLAAHAVWMAPGVDYLLVGSEGVRTQALVSGFRREVVQVTGMPVNPNFIDRLMGTADARAMLGWEPDLPVVLIVGGGDGIGGLDRIVRGLDAGLERVRLVVCAARNAALYERLRREQWKNPVHVLGFVDHASEMSVLMSAADILVTKAGPGTLHDAYLAALPVIVSGCIPGQEDANLTHAVQAGAACLAQRPRAILNQVRSWLADPAARDHAARCSRALARPEAASIAAGVIWDLATANK